jgi:integrase
MRTVGLPAPLVALLKQHRAEQDKERETATQLWREGDWVFSTRLGDPLSPSSDYHEWKRLLKAAGVRDGRLHDARHTAATVLLLLGVPERAVLGLMGWSNPAVARNYQHITAAVRDDVAKRLGGLLWANDGPPNDEDERDDGAAGVRVPA